MKPITHLPALCLLYFCSIACRKELPELQQITTAASASGAPVAIRPPDNDSPYRRSLNFIHYTSANTMIQSYLQSIDTFLIPQVRSFMLNADDLRTYLADTAIAELKVLLAHPGHIVATEAEGKYLGLRHDALTLVIVGVDQQKNYVLYQHSDVINRVLGCPSNCPATGTAALDLITLLP